MAVIRCCGLEPDVAALREAAARVASSRDPRFWVIAINDDGARPVRGARGPHTDTMPSGTTLLSVVGVNDCVHEVIDVGLLVAVLAPCGAPEGA